MGKYVAEIVIEGKANVADPEGEVILRDLIQKGGYNMVTSVRSGKYLRVTVDAKDPKHAEMLLQKMCNDLRIYNPVAHSLTIRVME